MIKTQMRLFFMRTGSEIKWGIVQSRHQGSAVAQILFFFSFWYMCVGSMREK